MGYDGTIQFDVGMDITQFQQGIDQISFLLDSMQVDGLSQKIMDQLKLGEFAIQAGLDNGVQFANGFRQGLQLLLVEDVTNMIMGAFANLPLMAFVQGQLVDTQFMLGLASGQTIMMVNNIVNSTFQQFSGLVPMVTMLSAQMTSGMMEQIIAGTPFIFDSIEMLTMGTVAQIEMMSVQVQSMILMMMLQMVNDILQQGDIANAVVGVVVGNIMDSFAQLPAMAATIMPQVFDGMANQMDALAPMLYQKASTIANNILAQLRSAFDIHSPSRKTKEIGTFVIEGFMEGLDENEKSAYKKVKQFANEIITRIEEPVTKTFFITMDQAMTQKQVHIPTRYAGQTSDKVTNSVNLGGLTQNFYAPQAPTASQATQQGVAFLEQARWKLPQMMR